MAPETPKLRRVRWAAATRVIASRYPPIDLFERVSRDPPVRHALLAAEMLVNPRLRDEIGEIRLVPAAERVRGPGATWVMAPFTHRNPAGSCFSDGSYGVLYAAQSLAIAVAETAFHFARIARDSGDAARREPMRVLVGRVDAAFHDVGSLAPARQAPLLDPHSYSAARAFARGLREADSNGIHYRSVRRPSGRCIAAFRPKAVGGLRQDRHLEYEWDGDQISRYFDFHEDAWISLETPFRGV